MKTIYLVLPCYNEEAVLHETSSRLKVKMNQLISENKISKDSRVTFVDDGSKDNTWSIIEELKESDELFAGVKLSRNRGHQNALLAGLMQVKDEVDVTISIDADLQDDVGVIEEMVEKYYSGCDIVYGVRNDRTSDSGFKKFTAEAFYKLMNYMGAKTVYNSADFRLMSNRALDELSLYSETHLFLRGLAPELGFKTDCVYYKRSPRLKGESKYPLKKMLSFAFNGVTSFSDKPLTLILYLGFIAILIAIIAVIYSLVQHASGHTIQGWTSLFASIWFIGGVQLVCLGVIGQYVGKTFIETKKRPRYYVESYLNHNDKE